MPRDEELSKLRDEAVEKEYKKLEAKGYRDDFIYPKLREKFYITDRTIEAILSGEYAKRKEMPKENPNQISIFDEISKNENS